jgi:hypothetical protein
MLLKENKVLVIVNPVTAPTTANDNLIITFSTIPNSPVNKLLNLIASI